MSIMLADVASSVTWEWNSIWRHSIFYQNRPSAARCSLLFHDAGGTGGAAIANR